MVSDLMKYACVYVCDVWTLLRSYLFKTIYYNHVICGIYMYISVGKYINEMSIGNCVEVKNAHEANDDGFRWNDGKEKSVK